MLSQTGQVLPLVGSEGKYVVMPAELYEAMIGLGDSREEALASVKQGIADTSAGQTRDMDEVFDRLEKKYAL